MTIRPTRVCVVREELVALTGNTSQALVLNQFLYWTKRCHDFDEMIAEENARRQTASQASVNMASFHGWIRKSLIDLGAETMLSASKESMRRFVTALMTRGWIESRRNTKNRWDRTVQYRVNLVRVARDLKKIGYQVPGFTFEGDAPLEVPEDPPAKSPKKQPESSSSPSSSFSEKSVSASKPSPVSKGSADSPQPLGQPDGSCISQKRALDVSECALQRPMVSRVIDKDSLKTKTKISTKTTHVSKQDFEEASDPDSETSMTPLCHSPSLAEEVSCQERPLEPESLAEQMVEIWNRVVEGRPNLVQVRHRRELLETFLKRHCDGNLSAFEVFCRTITSSRFLMGDLDRDNAWRMTLDAALEESKAIKVFEASYSLGDRAIKPRLSPVLSPSKPLSPTDKWRQQVVLQIKQRFSDTQEEAFFQRVLEKIPLDEYHFWIHKNPACCLEVGASSGDKIVLSLPDETVRASLGRYTSDFQTVSQTLFGEARFEMAVQGAP